LPLVVILAATALVACAEPQSPPLPTPAPPPMAVDDYPWLPAWAGELPPLTSLVERFSAPEGYERVALPPDGFGAWLRHLPVRLDRSSVLSWRDRPLTSPSAAIVTLDLGDGDLQQCADSIIRLHAEFLWATGRAHDAAYHFTSGDRSAWTDWAEGESFQVQGSRVRRLQGAPRAPTHDTYRSWLQHLFMYAGTLSLDLDSRPVPTDQPLQAGDFLVDPGSPGHAVVILDVATASDGRRVALVGQGYTPAQEFHVVTERRSGVVDGVWFPLPSAPDGALDTPSWRAFSRDTARRFPP